MDYDDGVDGHAPSSDPASPRRLTKSQARKSTATSVGGDEYAREADSRLSMTSTKSKSRRTDLEDDEEEDERDLADGQSFAGDALDTLDVGDQTFDTGGD